MNRNKPNSPYPANIDIRILPDEFVRGETMLYRDVEFDFGYAFDHVNQEDGEIVENVLLYYREPNGEDFTTSVPRSSVSRKFPNHHVCILDFFKKGTCLDLSMFSVNKDGVKSAKSERTRESLGLVIL